MPYDAIIISDVHLGAGVCQHKLLCEFLEKIHHKEIKIEKLIINGDLFDSWDFRRLSKGHWKVLSLIRKLSDKVETVWVNGNHDGPAEIVSHLLGDIVVEEYILTSGNKKILILHGDRFDDFLTDHPIITNIADFFYSIIQKLDSSFWMAKKVKHSSKTFVRCSEKVKELALKYGEKKKCDIVATGHTHLQLEIKDKYYNSGCWTELPCHYLAVKNGVVELKSYDFDKGKIVNKK